MDGVLLTLAVLACPVGMGAMMWLMMRGQRGNPPRSHDEIAELRSEVERLKAERAQRQSAAGEP